MAYNTQKNSNDCPLFNKDGKCKILNSHCYDVPNQNCEPIRRSYDIGFVDCHDLIHKNKINKNMEGK